MPLRAPRSTMSNLQHSSSSISRIIDNAAYIPPTPSACNPDSSPRPTAPTVIPTTHPPTHRASTTVPTERPRQSRRLSAPSALQQPNPRDSPLPQYSVLNSFPHNTNLQQVSVLSTSPLPYRLHRLSAPSTSPLPITLHQHHRPTSRTNSTPTHPNVPHFLRSLHHLTTTVHSIGPQQPHLLHALLSRA